MKRLLSLLLACALIFCMIPMQTLAASNSYEIESNDSKETATELSNGVTLSGSTGTGYSGSHDYLKFTLDTYANVTMRITVDGTDRRVTFEDDYETFDYIYTFYRYAGGTYERTLTKFLAPGTYYLVLIKGISEYTVRVSWTERECYCEHTGQWATKEFATCTKDGKATRVCTSCKMKEYKVLEATGHDWSEDQVVTPATCLKDGKTAKICNNCFTKDDYKTIPATGHRWDYGELTIEPYFDREGELKYICRSCEEEKTESIPALTYAPYSFGITWPEIPVFDGTAKEPKPVVSYQGKLLTEGTDYTVTYSNNILAGNHAVATVTGLGTYAGMEDTVTFVIQPRDIAELKDLMDVSDAAYVGRQVFPEHIEMSDANGISLTPVKDYSTQYMNNVQVGTGTVRIIGNGNYTGWFDESFEIVNGAAPDTEDKALTVNPDLDSKFFVLAYGTEVAVKPESKTYEGSLSVYQCRGAEKKLYDYASLSSYSSVAYKPDPGEYSFEYTYTVTVQECGYEYRNGVMVQVCYNRTEYRHINWQVRVVDSEPDPVDTLEAGEPLFQDSDTIYLTPVAKNNGLIQDVVWSSTDTSVATVTDGIVTILKPGSGSITATADGQTVTWTLDDISAVALSDYSAISHYDPATGAALVTWKNEVLDQDADYTVSTETIEGVTIVTASGINNFRDSVSKMFYEGTSYPYSCTKHKWTEVSCEENAICKICGAEGERAPGHSWKKADCENPQTCTVCAQTKGDALGHSYKDGTCTVCGAADPNQVAPVVNGVTRIAGGDRYQTSFKSADQLKAVLGVTKFQNIVVASGTDFPDALAGSYLAAQKDAPILLVRAKNVNDVKDYIKKNLVSGGNVYLLGGKNAVPTTMETGLDGFTVKRLGGATRYDTNLLILKEAGVGDKDIIVCTGLNFADSLSASAVGLPILLVKDGLYASQKEFLKTVSGDYIIIGGTVAVNNTVEKQLKGYGDVKRLAGNTRYDTSVMVAKEFFSNPTSAVLAYAQNFPDGLCGGPVAYNLNAPLILTDSNKPKAAVTYTTGLAIKSGYVLGGTGLISDKVVKNIFSMAAGDTITTK